MENIVFRFFTGSLKPKTIYRVLFFKYFFEKKKKTVSKPIVLL